MKITDNHKIFYASKKLKLDCKISIHSLINDQCPKMSIDKHNDLNLLKMVFKRVKREGLDLKSELFKVEIGRHSVNRSRLFNKVRLKLLKQGK